METSTLRKQMPVSALFDTKIIVPAIGSAFVKLDPRLMIKSPVMFVVEVVAVLTTVIFLRDLVTGAIAMFVGRFWMIIPAMAIAGSLADKKSVPPSAGTFPTTGGLFVGLVVGVILIIGGLTFFPALALGPIVEHLAMTAGTLFSSN